MNNLLSRKLAYSILLTGLCYSYTNLIPVFAAKPPAFPVQDNPVFSTPTPEEQKIAPESKQFIQGVVKMDVPNEAKADAYKIGNIEMEGNQVSQNWYIKQQIKSLLDKQGSLLSEKELEKALIQINKTNKFKLKAKVSQAKNKDTVDVHLDVYERNPWQITLTTDNQGRPGVGTYRWSSQIKNENLLGIGWKRHNKNDPFEIKTAHIF